MSGIGSHPVALLPGTSAPAAEAAAGEPTAAARKAAAAVAALRNRDMNVARRGMIAIPHHAAEHPRIKKLIAGVAIVPIRLHNPNLFKILCPFVRQSHHIGVWQDIVKI